MPAAKTKSESFASAISAKPARTSLNGPVATHDNAHGEGATVLETLARTSRRSSLSLEGIPPVPKSLNSTDRSLLHVIGTGKAVPSLGIKPSEEGFTLLNEQERFEVMQALQAQNPNPKSELNFNNPFELLCAVVLSAQATDQSVNKATPELFAAAPNPEAMAALGAEGIAPFIKSIGLWRNKAKHLAQIADMLHQRFNDEVPATYAELITLPGVGSKTAKVVLNVAFGQPFIAVDTHVFRVCNRTGLCLGKTPAEVEERLPQLIASEFVPDAHHYLLLHGRYVCTAKKFTDHCVTCVLAKWCKHNHAH